MQAMTIGKGVYIRGGSSGTGLARFYAGQGDELPAMLARGSGQIAFISSIAGLIGVYGYSACAASRFAVNCLVQVLRQELLLRWKF